MASYTVSIALLLFADYSCGNVISLSNPTSVVFARDQYEKGGIKYEGSYLPQWPVEATDHHSLPASKPHHFNVKKAGLAPTHQIAVSPEELKGRQIGRIKITSSKNVEGKLQARIRRSADSRQKRYYQYSQQVIQAPPLQSFAYFQPAIRDIQRPYVIPVWGPPNAVPLYFPPQQIYTNPGYPPYNPPRGIALPNRGYLPVAPPRDYLPPATENNMDLEDRFLFDDKPVWDTDGFQPVTPQPTRRPSTDTEIVPTRRPMRPGKATTHPPLVHKNITEESAGNNLSANRPSAPAPRPIVRPTQGTTSTTVAPSSMPRPSKCVWAIISCCSGRDEKVSYSCFEQLGCVGAFWDSSPCESDFAKAAIETALQYYNK